MNICLLTETFYPVTGGGETQARVLASGLAERGAKVHLITRRSSRDLPRLEQLGSVSVYRLAPSGPGQLKKWGLMITAMLRLMRMRRECDAIVVCGYRIVGIPAVAMSRMLGKPCVLKADSLGEMSGAFFEAGLARFHLKRTQWLLRKLLALRNRLLRNASAFVAISTPVADELVEHGVPPERIVRITNSVDTARFRPASPETKAEIRKRVGLPLQSRIFVYTGRLVTTKGLPLLLTTWRRVAPQHANAHLLLVGEGGLSLQNCEEELRSFVADNNLSDSVTFTGSVENVHDYLRASDCFIFPTEREAFGISVIEAMSCGLPVIATDVDGLRDVVGADAKTAIVVPARDGAALETAIAQSLIDETEMQRMSLQAREHVIQKFSERNIIRQYHTLLLELTRSCDEV